MKKKSTSVLLIGYGCVVAGLGLFLRQFAPEWPAAAVWAGVSGGLLSVGWGLLGIISRPRRGWAIFTLAVTGFVLLSQMITGWTTPGEAKAATAFFRWMTTSMFAITFGALTIVSYGTLEPSPAPDRR